MNLAESLLHALRAHGARQIFGIPGDFALPFFGVVEDELGLPVLTDVHEDTPLDEVAAVVDVLQTPAFLCRQTNFIQNVARTGKPVNIKIFV